ncbi:MAG TPA: endonuclease III, partial [Gemmataceae bacterium]|nr:endonuclease III [Gemmataceae bacterium]
MESLPKKRARTKKFISILKKAHPDAKLALDFSSPLELLIALILAAQARDDVVNQITAGLFKKYRTAADWAKEKPEILHEQLRRINFYRNKTKSIQNACRVLVE